MAYAYCIPARITEYSHPLNNRVSGMIALEGRLLTFATRKHIVQATNKIYAKSPWKPKVGSTVLIDGEMGATHVVVDHIEPDLCTDMPCEHELLDRLVPKLDRMPTATKHLRHWKPDDREDGRYRLRWNELVPKDPSFDVDRGAVLHAIRDSLFDEWRVWLTDADSGRVVRIGLPQSAERAVRISLGEEQARPAIVPPMPEAKLPFDDCPF